MRTTLEMAGSASMASAGEREVSQCTAHARGPWGPWTTVAFTILIAVAFSVAQVVVVVPYLVFKIATSPNANLEAAAKALETDGLFFALAELVSGPVALAITCLVVWLRKGPTVAAYLALRPLAPRPLLLWLLYALLLGIVLDGISVAAGYAVVHEWMLALFRSARSLPLILLAMIGMAPVLEEVVFRGFFLEGVRHSRLGDLGAVVLASFLWASVHLQYEWFYIGQIFVLGVLLGTARLRTGSLLAPIAMHALINALATLQVALRVALHSSK